MDSNVGESISTDDQRPNNILDILNDHCIQEIFTHLCTNLDFLNVAGVCKKFRENARKSLLACFKKLSIDNYICFSDVPPKRIPSFLRIFGDQLNMINLNYTATSQEIPHSDYIRLGHIDMITNYCSKTLLQLEIACSNDVQLDMEISSQFVVLEKLSINSSTINKLSPFPKLKELMLFKVKVKNCDWLKYEFPKLEQLYLLTDGLNDELFIEFQKKNPQLKSLTVIKSSLSSCIFQNIETRLPNLEELVYIAREDIHQFNANDFLHISNLTKLKCLIISERRLPKEPLIKSLGKKKVPIKKLEINDVLRR
ncbi:uncharacterized protein LOC116340813 [Contarinia nasturtii]|uniref:uncharacterized protein LOC116340813 n=1 Tax=Contarinia nasturtii TaxID=265458 RepID=UPI0012D4BBCF|nr:uncharacterized protein LOC116340813 [Contarinia nasturtii]XP_031623365.1 uncharacterized protein LOC116340813 [Contarinia nasturtii]